MQLTAVPEKWMDFDQFIEEGFFSDDCDCNEPPPPFFDIPPPPFHPPPDFRPPDTQGDCPSVEPQDVCPAVLVAGDAGIRPQLEPPVAALIVAVSTLGLIFIISAVICWR